jgi:hypothetical protein
LLALSLTHPFAGRYVEDVSPRIEVGGELGDLLATRAIVQVIENDRIDQIERGAGEDAVGVSSVYLRIKNTWLVPS